MMIAPQFGIGFICVPKAASTSVESVLEPHCRTIIAGTPGLKHLTYAQVEAHVLPLFDGSDTHRPEFFAIIRDPVDRLRSWYSFRRRPALARPENARHKNYTGNVSFAEFVEEHVAAEPAQFARVHPQTHFVTDASGAIGVQWLFRLEDVAARLPAFLSERGIKGITIPVKNTSDAGRQAIDPDLAARIRRHAAEDQALYERLGRGETRFGAAGA